MTIERYDWTYEGMSISEDGVYVHHSDYEDLQHELAEAIRDRDALRNRERDNRFHYTLANGSDMAINFKEA